MPAVYPVDLIAKRDKKEKMDRSIVKGWNVHFQTKEELEQEARLAQQKSEDEQKALEIYERLAQEAEQDDEKLRQEIEQARRESEQAFNARTNAYSGHYGREPVADEQARQQIDAILNEKPDAYDSAVSALQDTGENV